MSDDSDDDLAIIFEKQGPRRSIPAVGTAGVLKGLGVGLAPADIPRKHQPAPASSVKSSTARPVRPVSETSDASEAYGKVPYSAAKSAASFAAPSGQPSRGYAAPFGGYSAAPPPSHSRPQPSQSAYRPSAAVSGGRAASQPKALSRSRVIDDSDDDDDEADAVTGPYSRGSGGAGPKPSYGINPDGNAGATAEIAKQRLLDTHTAIIEEHRAAIERTADRLNKAIEEVDRFRSLEAAVLKERLAELDSECDAELADLEAQFRAAQVQCREKYRLKAEGERMSSNRRVQERADALMQMVEGGAGGSGGGNRRAGAVAAPAVFSSNGSGGAAGVGGGPEKFSGLRAKAAAAAGKVVVRRASDDED